jgi:hypothetical protein
MARADDPVVGQYFNPGTQYQVWADTFNSKMINSDDPRVPYTPVADMARGSQIEANDFLERMTRHDDLQLRGVVGSVFRRSGSMSRAMRVRGLGAGESDQASSVAASCEGFDYEKWVVPIAAFIYSHPDFVATGTPSKAATDDANAKFGAPQVQCVLYGLATGKIGKLSTEDGARLLQAGKKMREHGWWNGDNWAFYWNYLSGWTPVYKNPLYLGGAGVVALGAWWFLRKRRR